MPLVRRITPFIAGVTLMLALPAAASATDWRQFRYDVGQTGTNELETALTPTTVGGLQQAWTRSLGVETGWTAPLVLGNETIMGGWPAKVAAYATSTGKQLWSFAPDGTPENPFAASSTKVFVSTLEGPFYALDAATGEVLWQRDLGSSYAGGTTVSNGVVYATGGAQLWALDATTGAVLWTVSANRNIANTSTPAVSGGLVVLGTWFGVRAFSQDTGASVWRYAFAQRGFSAASIAGNAVFAASGRTELKLDLATGAVIWKKSLVRGNVATSTPAVGEGLVILHIDSDPSQREIYTARSATTGQVVWSIGYPAAAFGEPESSPAIVNGVVYVGSGNDPAVRAFDSSTGKPLWTGTLDGPTHSSPSVVNGQLEIGTLAGTLYAFRLP